MLNKNFRTALLLILTLSFGAVSVQADYGPRDCSQKRRKTDGFTWDERRGNPWEFDAGPSTRESESWLKLFGQIPNYRSVGKAIMDLPNEDIFRWQMGPMWYRGRLGKNQVKIWVVGQEGAQDENVTNRAFTGSTGTQVQKFLYHLGIYESYLFLNTFVYTLNSTSANPDNQRITKRNNPRYKNYVEMEQGKDLPEVSPIVAYRHQLFDNVVKQNPDSLALIMAVGSGARDSLATWINNRSGNNDCKENKINECDMTNLVAYFKREHNITIKNNLFAFNVIHPGSAKFGGQARARVEASFKRAAVTVANFIQQNGSGWLPADPQESQFARCAGGPRAQRLTANYKYDTAPIPFRDFAMGTNWRMGMHRTTSNRNGQARIMVFSEDGNYDDSKTSNVRQTMNFDRYRAPGEADAQLQDASRGQLQGMKDSEVPYEHPRYSEFGETSGDLAHVKQFDKGPTSGKARALMAWPDFKEIDATAYVNDESFGFGPSFRGNTRNPEIIIVADQMSHTDFFSTRALTGEGGQMLQAWLNRAGLAGKYLILRSLPVDTLGTPTAQAIALATKEDSNGNSAVKTIVNSIKAVRGRQRAVIPVITMGPVANEIGKELDNQKTSLKISQVVTMDQPDNQFSHVSQWITTASTLSLNVGTANSLKARTSFLGPIFPIPLVGGWEPQGTWLKSFGS